MFIKSFLSKLCFFARCLTAGVERAVIDNVGKTNLSYGLNVSVRCNLVGKLIFYCDWGVVGAC